MSKNAIVHHGDAIRLDRFLKERYHFLPLASLRGLLLQGAILVNGLRARKGLYLKAGDRVEIDSKIDEQLQQGGPSPNPALPCRLIAEEGGVVVFDKPAGLHTAPQRLGENGTAANWLAAHFPSCLTASPNPHDAGLLNRLDRGTSGLLLAAQSPPVYRQMRRLWQEHRVEKKYLALVYGAAPSAGNIRWPLAHHPSDPRRMVVIENDTTPHRGKIHNAQTEFRCRHRYPKASLLEVTLISGVMHQIRLHLQALGYPVVGETLYASVPPLTPPWSDDRYFLHAYRLAWADPQNGVLQSYESPLPQELSDYIVQWE